MKKTVRRLSSLFAAAVVFFAAASVLAFADPSQTGSRPGRKSVVLYECDRCQAFAARADEIIHKNNCAGPLPVLVENPAVCPDCKAVAPAGARLRHQEGCRYIGTPLEIQPEEPPTPAACPDCGSSAAGEAEIVHAQDCPARKAEGPAPAPQTESRPAPEPRLETCPVCGESAPTLVEIVHKPDCATLNYRCEACGAEAKTPEEIVHTQDCPLNTHEPAVCPDCGQSAATQADLAHLETCPRYNVFCPECLGVGHTADTILHNEGCSLAPPEDAPSGTPPTEPAPQLSPETSEKTERAGLSAAFVSASGDDGTADATEGKPFQTFEAALAALADGGEVTLLDGSYPTLSLTKNIKLSISAGVTFSEGTTLLNPNGFTCAIAGEIPLSALGAFGAVVWQGGAFVNAYAEAGAALDAATDGQTVRLLKELALSSPLEISKSIVFDGDGHTIRGDAPGYLVRLRGGSPTLQNLTLRGGKYACLDVNGVHDASFSGLDLGGCEDSDLTIDNAQNLTVSGKAAKRVKLHNQWGPVTGIDLGGLSVPTVTVEYRHGANALELPALPGGMSNAYSVGTVSWRDDQNREQTAVTHTYGAGLSTGGVRVESGGQTSYFATLDAAVSHANTLEDAALTIPAGSYDIPAGGLALQKPMTITGGAQSALNAADTAFVIESAGVTLRGLTISACVNAVHADGHGAALENCDFTGTGTAVRAAGESGRLSLSGNALRGFAAGVDLSGNAGLSLSADQNRFYGVSKPFLVKENTEAEKGRYDFAYQYADGRKPQVFVGEAAVDGFRVEPYYLDSGCTQLRFDAADPKAEVDRIYASIESLTPGSALTGEQRAAVDKARAELLRLPDSEARQSVRYADLIARFDAFYGVSAEAEPGLGFDASAVTIQNAYLSGEFPASGGRPSTVVSLRRAPSHAHTLPSGYRGAVVLEITLKVNGVKRQPNGSITLKMPVPDGAPDGADLYLLHYANPGDDLYTAIRPIITHDGPGGRRMMKFTTASFSEFILAEYRPAGSASNGGSSGGSSGGKSAEDRNYEYWEGVKERIRDARDGDTIQLNVSSALNIPASVLRELDGRDLTLVLKKGGREVVLYGLNMLEIPKNRIYYKFSALYDLYDGFDPYPEPDGEYDSPESSSASGVVIPSTVLPPAPDVSASSVPEPGPAPEKPGKPAPAPDEEPQKVAAAIKPAEPAQKPPASSPPTPGQRGFAVAFVAAVAAGAAGVTLLGVRLLRGRR